jgi:hypothetical protein
MKIIFWGIMLLIGLMATGSFIGVVTGAQNMVNIMKQENNINR